ncbi:MAG: hypothetical protein IJV31_11920, partial [Clostridia bacterium]|nr:hypothetical protein [Clostridia bacterium]
YCAPEKASSQNIMTYTSYNDLKAEVNGTNGKSYAWNNVEKNSDSGKGTKASTTGNIYGIYDMAGTLSENVASYVNAEGVSYRTNGTAMINGERYLGTSYPYNPTTTNNKDFTSAYPGFSKIFGDGIYEMSKAMGDGNGWFGQNFESDTANGEIYFLRSNPWYGVPSGILKNGDNRGITEWYAGFRSVLIPD